MSRILFSLPVHERPDIVEGQLANIAQHCPGAGVVLHVSPIFEGDMAEFTRLERHPGVMVNPNRLPTRHGQGLFHAHVVNFLHGMQQSGEFGTFAFLSSNELFIRTGLLARVGTFDAAAQIEVFDLLSDWHLFRRGIEHEPSVAALLAHLGLPVVFGGQAEGQFYNAALFAEMARLYLKFFPLGPASFETEELLPATMLAALLEERSTVSLPFTLQNYCHKFDIDAALIARLRRGGGFVFAQRYAQRLRSPHVNIGDLSSVFSVKRVPRETCELRDHILALDQAA